MLCSSKRNEGLLGPTEAGTFSLSAPCFNFDDHHKVEKEAAVLLGQAGCQRSQIHP